MKKQILPRVPTIVTTALQETASHLGGLGVEVVITAATWAFCKQDTMTRRWIVEDLWFKGLSELEASRVDHRYKTFKEKIYALPSYCYTGIRRRLAQ